jgi:hypothetical protein
MTDYHGAVEIHHSGIPGLRGNVFRNPEAGPSLSAQDGVQTMYV